MRRAALLLAATLLPAVAAGAQAPLPAAADSLDWRGPAALEIQVEDAKGKNLADAEIVLVYLSPEGGGSLPSILTDAHGKANIGGLAAGRWTVEIRHAGHMSFRAELALSADGKPVVESAAHQMAPGATSTMKVKFSRGRGGAVPVAPARAPAPTVALAPPAREPVPAPRAPAIPAAPPAPAAAIPAPPAAKAPVREVTPAPAPPTQPAVAQPAKPAPAPLPEKAPQQPAVVPAKPPTTPPHLCRKSAATATGGAGEAANNAPRTFAGKDAATATGGAGAARGAGAAAPLCRVPPGRERCLGRGGDPRWRGDRLSGRSRGAPAERGPRWRGAAFGRARPGLPGGAGGDSGGGALHRLPLRGAEPGSQRGLSSRTRLSGRCLPVPRRSGSARGRKSHHLAGRLRKHGTRSPPGAGRRLLDVQQEIGGQAGETSTLASLKQALPPRSERVSGASAQAVAPFSVLCAQSPFGSSTTPGR